MNQQKINELINWMKEKDLSVTYIANPNSIAYLSGFHSDPHERVLALLLSQDNEPFLFAPALEVEAAKQSGWGYDVLGYLDTQDPWAVLSEAITTRFGQPASLAIEKTAFTLDRFEQIHRFFPTTDFSTDATAIIQQMQLKKTKQEISTLLEAGDWADVAFEIGFAGLKEGVTEQEIVAEIEYQLKRKGVSKMSFDTTVLFGAHAANPHGSPDNTQLQANQLALFDLGVVWKGYCSDATRTVAYKEPTAFQEKIYNIVLEAQLAAQKAAKPGMKASDLDAVARDIISSYGYGEAFNHRLGHGLGTSVHEFPSIVAGNDFILEEGMCFSIEPGIYLPDQVGVRIEDCVYLTKDGCKPLTQSSKELLIIE
jgi:Xaa-Pro aminopeptidase